MDQEEIRKRLNGYIQETSISAKRIASDCKIPEYTLSKYRHNKIDLYEKSLQVLSDYLQQHNA